MKLLCRLFGHAMSLDYKLHIAKCERCQYEISDIAYFKSKGNEVIFVQNPFLKMQKETLKKCEEMIDRKIGMSNDPCIEHTDNGGFIQDKYGHCFYTKVHRYIPKIYNLYVYPKYRGMGHARRYVRSILKEIRATWDGEVNIEVVHGENGVDSNRLRRFYTEEGLTVIDGEHI